MAAADSTAPGGRSPQRWLYVEDHPAEVTLVRHLLQTRHPEIDLKTASDGEAALQALRQEPWPDLILLDLDLPGLDGLTLLRLIRAMPEGVRVSVVILTGFNQPDAIESCYRAGASAFVVKPAGVNRYAELLEMIIHAHFRQGGSASSG